MPGRTDRLKAYFAAAEALRKVELLLAFAAHGSEGANLTPNGFNVSFDHTRAVLDNCVALLVAFRERTETENKAIDQGVLGA